MKSPHWTGIAAILGGLAVALGAFGAHRLPALLDEQDCPTEEKIERVEHLETGVRYQMYHALALLMIGMMSRTNQRSSLRAAAGLFIVGTFLFSGGLYWLAFVGTTTFHYVIPLGGGAFLFGWIALGISAWKRAEPE